MKNPERSVLLIDDDRATNFFNERVVKRHGHFEQVSIVESGQQALDYLLDENNVRPDLIFLDINMPAMNGWEFIEAFKKLNDAIRGETKLIMLTTSSNPDDLDRSLQNETVDDYINKPLSPAILNEVINTHFSIEVVDVQILVPSKGAIKT